MICGHERETLAEALGYAEFDPEDSAHLAQWQGPVEEDDKCFGQWQATQAIHDPAKIAAIMVGLVAERGVWRWSDAMKVHHVSTLPTIDVTVSGNGVTVWYWKQYGNGPDICRAITLPQARAFALRLLDAPTATLADVGRMIEEVTR